MKLVLVCLLTALVGIGLVTAASGQDVPAAAIQKAIDDMPEYKDVPSSVSCKKPISKADQLICNDPYLRLMEILNTRAAVYAEENATHKELDHKHYRITAAELRRRNRLTTSAALRKFFIEQTNDSLGGESPYYKDQQ